MRIQINNGLLEGLSNKTVIASGDCQGENTHKVNCDIPELFDENMTSYEATIENNQVIELTLKH